MGSDSSYLSNTAIFHFHDYGRKSIHVDFVHQPSKSATLPSARNKEFAAFKRSFIYLCATQTAVVLVNVPHGMVEEVLALFQRVCVLFVNVADLVLPYYCCNMGHVLGYVILGMTVILRGKSNEVQWGLSYSLTVAYVEQHEHFQTAIVLLPMDCSDGTNLLLNDDGFRFSI